MTNDERKRSVNSPDVAGDWEIYIRKGGKVQRKVLRLLSPSLIAVGIRPADLDQTLFETHGFPHHATCIDPTQERKRRGDVNSFVRAFNTIGATLEPPLHVLFGIEGPMDRKAAEKETFKTAFGEDLSAYFADRQVADDTKNHDLNGLFNAYDALASEGIIVSCLRDMISEDNIELIKDVYDEKNQKGALIQVITALAHLAKQDGDEACRNDLIKYIRGKRCKPALTDDQINELMSYLGKGRLAQVLMPIFAVAAQASGFFIDATRSQAHRVSAALSILIMIYAPASFGTVYKARFEKDEETPIPQVRPPLALPAHSESIEQPLHSYLRGLITEFYNQYAGEGIHPEGLTPHPDGSLRSKQCARTSIEALLAEYGIGLTLLQLRDLGIARALDRGKTLEDLARAARLSPRAMKDRYKGLMENIEKARRVTQ